jgi:hypothetical protein
MKLFTKEIEQAAAKIGCQDGKGDEAKVIAKFFCTRNNWRWYATEWDAETGRFFGLVSGFEVELGYFSLAEFEEMNAAYRFPIIERDLYFENKTIADARKEIGRGA